MAGHASATMTLDRYGHLSPTTSTWPPPAWPTALSLFGLTRGWRGRPPAARLTRPSGRKPRV